MNELSIKTTVQPTYVRLVAEKKARMRTSLGNSGNMTTAVVWGDSMFIDGICGKLWERNNLTYFKMHQLTIPQQLALEQLNSMLIAYLGTALNSLRHLHSAWQRQRQRRPPCSQWGKVIYKGLGDVGCYINPSFSETSTFQLQNPVPFLTGKTGLYSRHVLDASDCPSSSDWAKEGFRNGTDSWGVFFFCHAGHSFHFSPTTWLVLCDLAASDWVVL